MNEKMKRKPKFEKAGCFFKTSSNEGFHLFDGFTAKDGDVFIYNRGILFKIKKPEGK